MLRISRIKLRGFKSFTFADIPISQGFLCLAGPNGSGKSNLTDAVRFALGETSLKSLRAKKVRDLISNRATMAEVTLFLEGDGKYEIKRAIRNDGKLLYRLNGNRTTRGSIHEVLKDHNIDESGRNFIAQGEVQRIIQMGGKERRMIIDSVAGISDFEQKKKEAMRELEIVDTRIRESNLVLGERIGFLSELEKEKESALKFIDNKKRFGSAKASLLSQELEKYEKDLEKANQHLKKIKTVLDNKRMEMATIEAEIAKINEDKSAISIELEGRQKASALVKRIEELRASVASKQQLIDDKNVLLKKLENERNALVKEHERLKSDIQKLENEMNGIRAEIEKLEREKIGYAESTEKLALDTEVKECEKKVQKVNERIAVLESEMRGKEELLKARRSELEALAVAEQDDEDESKLKSEIEMLKDEINALVREMDTLFKREKGLNVDIAEADKRLLGMKEKAAILKVQASGGHANIAMRMVQELKEKGIVEGIYGTVADLIKFDQKYAAAVEAAGGSRLFYVVVEDADVAIKCIRELKKSGGGRVTFIPLMEVKTSGAGGEKIGMGLILNFINYDAKIAKAMEYVFGETYLVGTMEEARKTGMGKARMVTLDGEIFEKSGIISGGRSKGGSALAISQLTNIEADIEGLKKEREGLFSQLSAVREEMNRKRSLKVETEIKVKNIENDLVRIASKKSERMRLQERAKQIEEEIIKLKRELKEGDQTRIALLEERKTVNVLLEKKKEEWKKAEEREKRLNEEVQKKRTDLASMLSSLKAGVEGKARELELRKNEWYEKEERIKKIDGEMRECNSKITSLEKQIANEQEELRANEDKVSKSNREMEILFENMKTMEARLQEIGKHKGTLQFDIEKLTNEANQLGIKKATAETKLIDLKAEFENYKEYEILQETKEYLQNLIKESEAAMAALGNVNMASIELYDKKKAEIDEMKSRITKLEEERRAIMDMITQIDERKKEVFFETFYAVNDNFKKMFRYINIGEGYLLLDKPNEPFDSGLYIKIKRKNKDGKTVENSIESLSGGENSLVALMFIFAMQMFKPSPFYILDEIDAALDKENSKNMAKLIKEMSKNTQFIVVSHNDTVISSADSVFGIAKVDGVSKIVGIKLAETQATDRGPTLPTI